MELPEGTCDVLPEIAYRQRQIQQTFLEVLIGNGYLEVKTPGFELYEFLRRGFIAEETMYKFTDHRGRILALRPDFTLSVMRLAVSQLQKDTIPWKLCYTGEVYRIEQPESGKLHEYTQVGAEILGAPGQIAEAEAIWLAAQGLRQAGCDSFRVVLGDCRVTSALLKAADLTIVDQERVRCALRRQDLVELERCLNGAIGETVFRCLTERTSVLDTAKELLSRQKDQSVAVLEQLEALHFILARTGLEGKVEIDFGLVRPMPYYTGIVFEFYAETSAVSIGGGGRYDSLSGVLAQKIPAVGFAVNVTEVARIIGKTVTKIKERPSYFLANVVTLKELKQAFVTLQRLKEQGYIGEIDLLGGNQAEIVERARAKGHNIVLLWTENRWQEIPVQGR